MSYIDPNNPFNLRMLSGYNGSQSSTSGSNNILDWSNPFKGGFKGGLGASAVGLAPAIGGVLGSTISGGYSSGAGNALNTMGDLASAIPGPWGAAASGALKIVGGLTNAAFGTKVNQQALNEANAGTNTLNSFTSNANSFDEISDAPTVAEITNPYKSGFLNRRSARKKNAALRDARDRAEAFAQNSILNNINNLQDDQTNNLLANFSANGGNIMTNGTTWDTGLTFIGNGGSHESNPYEGVQVGVDPQGIPNLVEEGEYIWNNDYVFSRRLKVPKSFRDKYKLKGKDSISFAEAAERFSKESKERPNDPISKSGRDTLLTALMDQQEAIREKKEQREAINKFNSMSPEEQIGLMADASQYTTPVGLEGELMNKQEYPQTYAEGGLMGKLFSGKGKYTNKIARANNTDWFISQAKRLGIIDSDNEDASTKEFLSKLNFSDNQKDSHIKNLEAFNNIYAEYQKKAATKNYITKERNKWKAAELDSRRFKMGDNGTSVYKAKFFSDSDLGKDFIDRLGNRITRDEYNTLNTDYQTLRLKNENDLTPEEKSRLSTFQDASYKESPVVKGQFVKDYNGNIEYDYTKDVSDSWIPNNIGSDYKWNSRDASKITYSPNSTKSFTESLRYAPAIGGAIGLLASQLPVDYSNAERIENAARGTADYDRVSFNPIGNYLTYKPLDTNYIANQLRASEQASARNIMNTSAGNRGTAMAGLLANNYNSQLALANAYRQADDANLAQRQKVEEFNRGTNITNSQGLLTADRYNQEARAQAQRGYLSGIDSAARIRQALDSERAQSRSANLTNMLNSLGQIGEEAYNNRMFKGLVDRGVLEDIFKSKRSYGGLLTKPRKNKRK